MRPSLWSSYVAIDYLYSGQKVSSIPILVVASPPIGSTIVSFSDSLMQSYLSSARRHYSQPWSPLLPTYGHFKARLI